MVKVDPLTVVIPASFEKGQRRWLRYFQKVVYDLWLRSGGSTDGVSTKLVDVTADYTTTGDFSLEIVNCINTVAITIALQTLFEGQRVRIIRAGTGAVTVNGNGATIIGENTQVMRKQYNDFDLVATSVEWVL